MTFLFTREMMVTGKRLTVELLNYAKDRGDEKVMINQEPTYWFLAQCKKRRIKVVQEEIRDGDNK